MDSKNSLVNAIKIWVKKDNEIRQLKKEERIRKKEQKEISETLMAIMKENEIDEFDLKDGKLVYTKKNIKKPITKKGLLDILKRYYNDDTQKADELNNFIMDNREEKVVETITRTIKGEDKSSS
tara:strand:+ start:4976 stop:5347 length:372 start_codon:yes stop_codon:yes gene_type:complete